jgi:site-specific DNA-methyltransferase (adenine-specific)
MDGSRPVDEGSFSRYFSLDAWWNERIKELPESIRKTFPFLIEPKASKEERNEGLEGLDKKTLYGEYSARSEMGWTNADSPNRKNHDNKRTNFHPTVKPLAIMSYLITLGSRRGDTVLDPFAGSGTTIMAAKMLGRKGIGIEINPEYAKIAEARIRNISTIEGWIADSSAPASPREGSAK